LNAIGIVTSAKRKVEGEGVRRRAGVKRRPNWYGRSLAGHNPTLPSAAIR